MCKSTLIAASFTAMALVLGGYQSGLTGGIYNREEARTVQTARTGTVRALRLVKIEGTKAPIGSTAGVSVDGVVGSTIGNGKGSYVVTIIGMVAGGLPGAAAKEDLTRTQGIEITVHEDDGSTRAYVRQVDQGQIFRVDERVHILTINGISRVAH